MFVGLRCGLHINRTSDAANVTRFTIDQIFVALTAASPGLPSTMLSKLEPRFREASFRGAGSAREPGNHEHRPLRMRPTPVFLDSGARPFGPSRNDGELMA